MANKVNKTVYQCSVCKNIYLDEYVANICCKQYRCEVCGVKTNRALICDSCHEKRAFVKAVKMTVKEWEEKYPDNMVYYGDEYFYSVEDCMETLRDRHLYEILDLPNYIWGTEEFTVDMDAESILDDMEENSNIEDFEIDKEGREILEWFLKGWNKKYGGKGYMATNIAILIPKESKEAEYV